MFGCDNIRAIGQQVGWEAGWERQMILDRCQTKRSRCDFNGFANQQSERITIDGAILLKHLQRNLRLGKQRLGLGHVELGAGTDLITSADNPQ